MIDIKKFENLENLSISEEMLGAYLEGNLHGAEYREVQNCIHDDVSLSSLIDCIEGDMYYLTGLDYSYQQDSVDVLITDDMFSEISLPEITTYGEDSLIDLSSLLNDGITLGCEYANIMGDDSYFHHPDNPDNVYLHNDPEFDNVAD